jgi:hypothetical protein
MVQGKMQASILRQVPRARICGLQTRKGLDAGGIKVCNCGVHSLRGIRKVQFRQEKPIAGHTSGGFPQFITIMWSNSAPERPGYAT